MEKVEKYVNEQKKRDIDERVSRAECKEIITPQMLDLFEGDQDLYSIISEQDRIRLCYKLLNKIKLAAIKRTSDAFPSDKYSRLDKNECLLDFFKRTKIFKDITPLHSRSRFI